MGSLLAIVLAFALELGCYCAANFQVEQVQQRKERMGTIRDSFFILVSLLLGFTLTLAASRFVERRSLRIEEVNQRRER